MVRDRGDLGSVLLRDSVCDSSQIGPIIGLDSLSKLHPHLLHGSGNPEDGKLNHKMASKTARSDYRSYLR